MTTTVLRLTNRSADLGSRPAVQLRISSGGDAERQLDLPAAGVVVGSDPSSDVVVEDAAVSRRHVFIQPVATGFRVKDLGSKNGTWLDGIAVTDLVAQAGTCLRLGRSTVMLVPAEERVDVSASSKTSFGALRGSSEAMRRTYAIFERASASDVPVLLLGESGTGKELAARAIHEQSPRRDRPFVVFDCGAASDTLIEGELFGHKRGAFTGAQSDRPGAFALAHGGTLFLDEIGDLPLPLQPKLLRLLERGEVMPLGARQSEHYDVRIVAATHRDLWEHVGVGTFRADLFYRLAVVEVVLPSLRKRREDIPELVRCFLRAHHIPDDGVEGRELDRLMEYSWPGNVRELRNVVASAVALAEPGSGFAKLRFVLRRRSPAAEEAEAVVVRADRPYHEAKDELLGRFDRAYCTDLLKRANNNISQAARLAGLERKYLYKVLERAGLAPSSAKSE
jgi:DNA-binding NtrC family response regulator